MEKVVIIPAGGTIAMSKDPDTGSVKPLSDRVIDHLLSDFTFHADIEIDPFRNVPSPHITPSDMLELSQKTRQHLARNEVTGVVITHGTDTLEETAYFLDLTLPHDKPVIMTGAIRSSDEPGADGPLNLANAVRAAAHPQSRGRGCMVVLNDEIHAARHVTKTHTSNVAAFQSPGRGPMGHIWNRDISYHHGPDAFERHAVSVVDANVPLIKTVTGMRAEWLDSLLKPPVDGLVIEAFGQGNVPPSIMPVIRLLRNREIPIVLVSRCFQGVVRDTYGYEGGGRELKKLGVIFANGLNGQKARIKLIVLLASGKSESLTEHFS